MDYLFEMEIVVLTTLTVLFAAHIAVQNRPPTAALEHGNSLNANATTRPPTAAPTKQMHA